MFDTFNFIRTFDDSKIRLAFSFVDCGTTPVPVKHQQNRFHSQKRNKTQTHKTKFIHQTTRFFSLLQVVCIRLNKMTLSTIRHVIFCRQQIKVASERLPNHKKLFTFAAFYFSSDHHYHRSHLTAVTQFWGYDESRSAQSVAFLNSAVTLRFTFVAAIWRSSRCAAQHRPASASNFWFERGQKGSIRKKTAPSNHPRTAIPPIISAVFN